MNKIRKLFGNFTKGELLLWGISVFTIVFSFFVLDSSGNYLSLAASLIGATSLIFSAKGNPLGPFFAIFFSILYGIISYSFAYYGEMITYLGMTGPMAVFALISWLRNPYSNEKTEVKVNTIGKTEVILMSVAAVAVTVLFYFILKAFDTANLVPSTISVTTSFLAVYLTFRRNEFYAVAYAANDVILIILWGLATISDISYLSVTICFVIFLANDIYGFVSWSKMKKRQSVNAQMS